MGATQSRMARAASFYSTPIQNLAKAGCDSEASNPRRLFLGEVDGFVFVAGDAGADLRGRPTGLGFVVSVEALCSADVALGGMRRLIATVQTGVAQGAVAAAIARQLINDAGDLDRELIGAHLPVVAEVGTLELSAMENGRNGMDIERRRWMVGGNIVSRVGPLRVARSSERENRQSPDPAALEKVLHDMPQFL